MSNLLDSLSQPPKREYPCAVRALATAVSPEEWSVLTAILNQMADARRNGTRCDYTVAWVAEKLSENGYEISPASVTRHVKGLCSCE